MGIEIVLCLILGIVGATFFRVLYNDWTCNAQMEELRKLIKSNDLAWALLSIDLEDLGDLVIMHGSSDEDKEFKSRLPCATPDQLLGALHDKVHTESESPMRVSKNRIRTVKGE